MDGLKLRRPRLSSACHREFNPDFASWSALRPTLWKSALTSRYFRPRRRRQGAKGAERSDAPVEGPRPKVGKAVIVVHALGAGAVPVDLEGAGFELVGATDGEAAFSTIRSGRADIAIVDSRFEGDGLAFCEQLWSEHAGFPVVLIGPNDENLVTKALLSGADDFLPLPLRPAELVARVPRRPAPGPALGGRRSAPRTGHPRR